MATKFEQLKTVTETVCAFPVARKAAWLGVVLAMAAGSTSAFAQDTSVNDPVEDPMPAPSVPATTTPALRTPAAPAFAPANDAAQPALDLGSEVRVDDNMTVDLHVKDEDLANVLEMLSIQSQKNIIASKDVNARVTANLYGVTFYEALDAILNVNGYGFIEEGNFIKIYTLEELQKIQAANRAKISKVLSLNYMASVDAAEFVKPLLSPEGQIKVNSKAAAFAGVGETPVGGEDYASNNVLVVYDFEENVAQVEEMLRQIDTKPAQVLVEATILQTQLNDAVALGVDFSVVADMDFGQLDGSPLSAVAGLLAGPNGSDAAADRGGSAVVGNVGNVASGNGGLKIGILSNDIGVFVRALDEVTDTTVLSNPKIMTLNRQSSRVLVGRKVGYLSTTATDTSTTQSVEFLDTGTSLYFRPFVTNDNMIRMELKPKVAEAAIRQVTDVGGSAVTIPDEITNELTTNILVRDGQTVVLGGLFRESVTSTRKQVPVLGDIPILGNAFRGKEDTTSRNEIIFLVTPTILNDATITDSGQRGGKYIADITAGAREGVLFFSRERMTNNLNIEADRLYREGNSAEALNKIERSLSLSPVQPELTQLRERITGSKAPSLNRSFLDRVIDKEASGSLLQVKAEENQVSSNDATGPEYDPNYVGSNIASDNAQYEYMMPQAQAFAAPQEQNDTGLSSFAQDAVAESAQQNTTNDASFDSGSDFTLVPESVAQTQGVVEASASGWNDDAVASNTDNTFSDWNQQTQRVAVPTQLSVAPLTLEQAQQFFQTSNKSQWLGPTGFVRNVTSWNQFVAQWQQNQGNTYTNVDPNGQ